MVVLLYSSVTAHAMYTCYMLNNIILITQMRKKILLSTVSYLMVPSEVSFNLRGESTSLGCILCMHVTIVTAKPEANIFLLSETYHVEPLTNHLPASHHHNRIVYKDSDVNYYLLNISCPASGLRSIQVITYYCTYSSSHTLQLDGTYVNYLLSCAQLGGARELGL